MSITQAELEAVTNEYVRCRKTNDGNEALEIAEDERYLHLEPGDFILARSSGGGWSRLMLSLRNEDDGSQQITHLDRGSLGQASDEGEA